MKTPVEMQLKIIDKMRENVESGVDIFMGTEWLDDGEWIENTNISFDCFRRYKFRVKPETITINGAEIPRPLEQQEVNRDGFYYFVSNNQSLFESHDGVTILDRGIFFVYETKEEAIEASKLLFGLKD